MRVRGTGRRRSRASCADAASSASPVTCRRAPVQIRIASTTRRFVMSKILTTAAMIIMIGLAATGAADARGGGGGHGGGFGGGGHIGGFGGGLGGMGGAHL